MKKIMSIIIALIICLSQLSFVSAANNYTVKNSIIKKSDKFLDINIAIPYFEGFTSADKVNKIIKDLVADSIDDIQEVAKSLNEIDDEESIVWKSVLDISYNYFLNKDILSIQLNNYTFSGGAHGMTYILPITMNIKTGEIYNFKDLFQDGKSATKKIQDILIQTIDKNPENYFKEYKESIRAKNGDFNFYIDGAKIIVYFDLYDIAPYSSGIHHFAFPADELKSMLKDEVYNSIKDSQSLEGVLFNGSNYSSQEIILDQDGIPLVPLRIVAEALGYKVDWNKTGGPIVNGNPLTNLEYKIHKGVTHVPLQYFVNTLKENVSFASNLYINTSKSKYNLEETIFIKVFDKGEDLQPYYDLLLK